MPDSYDKIKKYYAQFDEWARLDSASGTLELLEVIRIVSEYVPPGVKILDLGGGAGRVTIELAKVGYMMGLVDLSETLIKTARKKIIAHALADRVPYVEVGNATHLPEIGSAFYDAVLCCGPFYHLVEERDRIAAAKEAIRVCKAGGTLLIGIIPRFSGLAGLVGRAARSPEQLSPEVFRLAAEEGVFHNASSSGFQEGYYPRVAEAKQFWEERGLEDVEVISTRSFLHQNETEMLQIRQQSLELFESILEAHRAFSREEAFVEAGGHALVVGRKHIGV